MTINIMYSEAIGAFIRIMIFGYSQNLLINCSVRPAWQIIFQMLNDVVGNYEDKYLVMLEKLLNELNIHSYGQAKVKHE